MEFPDSKSASGETRLSTPLLREGVAIGVIGIRRTELRPFTESQIKLIETFAKQAVIAIENVRLFNELKEHRWNSRRRRAKSWASSPARRLISSRCWMWLLRTRARLCDAEDAVIFRVDGDALPSMAAYADTARHFAGVDTDHSGTTRSSGTRSANHSCP